MKLGDALENYNYYSGKLSDIVRQLAFAGIAVVWVFKADKLNTIPPELIRPTLLIVVALALDLMQYFYASIAWSCFHRYMENRARNTMAAADEEFLAPRAINWASIAFFYLKTICLGAGYWFLYRYLSAKLF